MYSFEVVTAYYRDLAKAEETFRKALDRIRLPAEIAAKAKILTDAVPAAMRMICARQVHATAGTS